MSLFPRIRPYGDMTGEQLITKSWTTKTSPFGYTIQIPPKFVFTGNYEGGVDNFDVVAAGTGTNVSTPLSIAFISTGSEAAITQTLSEFQTGSNCVYQDSIDQNT